MTYKTSEQERAAVRRWRDKHPGYWKSWKKRPAEKSKALQRGWRARNPRQEIFNQTKSRAKKNGTPFTIAFSDIFWPTLCPVLGLELNYDKSFQGSKKVRADQPTLDRWNNSKGYDLGNVFVISHQANRWKSNMALDDAEALLGYMTKGPTSAEYCIEATETMGGYYLPELSAS